MADRVGRIHGLFMATTIRPWGRPWLAAFLLAARNVAVITAPLRRLALIRAAHWTVVRSLPDGKGGWRPLRPPYLLFESNFDIDLNRYIEVFAQALPWHMRGVWASGGGYPGVLPHDAFHRWVDEHTIDAGHYWCAYPNATTRMVDSALRVADRLSDFRRAVEDTDDETFAAEWDRLLTDVGSSL